MISALTRGPKHHFFGYFGVNAWDPSQQYHLALETSFDDHRPVPEDVATVGLVDREDGSFRALARTSAFNLQQGSMMHWLDAGFGPEFTYNDWEGNHLVSRAVNPDTGEERTIQGAVAAVSPVEPIGIGLSFARMAHCRPVVGYANSGGVDEDRPEEDGLHLLDFRTGKSSMLVSIADVIRANPCEEALAGPAWFNHVYFNTDGTRLLFMCRIKLEEGHCTSVWSVNTDGSELAMQIPYGVRSSHFCWRDPKRVVISTDLAGQMGFMQFRDRAGDFEPFGQDVLPRAGHNCFSPDRRWMVCDSKTRGSVVRCELMLYEMDTGKKISLGEFEHPGQYVNDIRCDLHPRWAPDGKTISFDSVHEGTRQIHLADVSGIV